MRTDKLKKYLIPNIPYLFILWACLKLGTAYRLAAGADVAHKLMGLGQTIGPAFADFAPGLAPFDWLVGIVGAAAFRLLIYTKSKNAKKYRRDEEYGSARFGTEKDIKPFVDPKEMFFRLWNALNSLPELQGRRVDAHLILGKSYREIAREEGVDKSAVRCSVLCGIKRMKKYLRENF